ncbi:unnamed protein product, partial [Prunus brigantina]
FKSRVNPSGPISLSLSLSLLLCPSVCTATYFYLFLFLDFLWIFCHYDARASLPFAFVLIEEGKIERGIEMISNPKKVKLATY